MSQTIRAHNLKVMVATVALAVLVFLVVLAFMLQPAARTDARNPAVHATSAGGASLAQDPFIDRHTEVVARHHGIIPH
jgi:hypothetical protein